MKYAVITPYYKEPTEKLWRCHASVKAQTIPADQIMVATAIPIPKSTIGPLPTFDCRYLKTTPATLPE
jgi:hypothetical protein